MNFLLQSNNLRAFNTTQTQIKKYTELGFKPENIFKVLKRGIYKQNEVIEELLKQSR